MVRLTLVLPCAVDCSLAVTNNSPVWRPQGHHTGLLLVTANEQSAAQGNTWGLTLKPGFDCLSHLNTFLDYLGDLDYMEDYMKTTLLNAKLGTFWTDILNRLHLTQQRLSLRKTEITFKYWVGVVLNIPKEWLQEGIRF